MLEFCQSQNHPTVMYPIRIINYRQLRLIYKKKDKHAIHREYLILRHWHVNAYLEQVIIKQLINVFAHLKNLYGQAKTVSNVHLKYLHLMEKLNAHFVRKDS